jgi:hypothetical protein
VTSFNDPVRYALHPAMLQLGALAELSVRALSLDLIQARYFPPLPDQAPPAAPAEDASHLACHGHGWHTGHEGCYEATASAHALSSSSAALRGRGEGVWCGGCAQDGISQLQALEVLEVVGARELRIEPGLGRLGSLRELEFNACECAH